MNNLFTVGLVVLIIWGVVEFIGAYWKILLALSAVGLFVYIICRPKENGNEYKPIEPIQNEVEEAPITQSTDIARLIEIYFESLSLVDKSENIATVNGRYNDCLKVCSELAEIPSPDFDVYRKKYKRLCSLEYKINLFDAAIDRYLRKQVAEIENLRTASAKDKRIEKILKLLESLEHVPKESKAYARKILSTQISSSKALVTADVNLINAIPPGIIQLLWFADGASKNYVFNIPTAFKTKFFSITFPAEEEPSLIRTTDFIGIPVSPAPKLDYFPSYSTMTPNARATYLHWLHNIDSEIEIGYVFVFYYGLERWLLTGNKFQFDKAFDMVLRLRAHHANKSFDSYSSTALAAACLIRNRPDMLKRLLTEKILLSPIWLACLGQFNFYLNATAIMQLAAAVGFKNKRYIKSHGELFHDVLEEIIAERFSDLGYPLTEQHLIESPQRQEILFANFSLKREGIIPDIAGGETFRKDLSQLLTATHDKVKSLLKERR